MTLDEYLLSIKGKRVCVIGAGISNRPLISLLRIYNIDVTVCDARSFTKMGAETFELINCGCTLRLGEDYLDDLNYDIIFRTPGLMPTNEKLQAAVKAGAVLTSEMELFLSLCPCKVVAITGSDGKTTTSTVIAELLRREGYNVHLGGNIGRPLLCEVPMMKKEDICVVELSSFQLHSMMCSPDVAVITNVSPNHLDKHGTLEDYIEAKTSIFRNQKENAVLVLNAEDSLTPSFSAEAKGEVRTFSSQAEPENGVFLKGGVIYSAVPGTQPKAVLDSSEILVPGFHNVLNFMTAYCAVRDLVSAETFKNTAREFKGVEHRLELVCEHGGVRFINDSIGSSPTRTIAGLRSFDRPLVVIAGGYDKHLDYSILGDELCLRAKKLFVTGDTAGKIIDAVRGSKYYSGCTLEPVYYEDFEENVKAAASAAESGDVVLFSPASASFDRFKNFEERGRFFKSIVMELCKDER